MFGNSSDDIIQTDFYSPLCKNGYLTPLQRKKLRDKRKLDDQYLDEKESDNLSKRSRRVKKDYIQKKRKISSNTKKIKENVTYFKVKTAKLHLPQVKCAVSKILNKTSENIKDRKFFKTSPTRLQRANFTMSLELSNSARRNMFNSDKLFLNKLENSNSKEHAKELFKTDPSNNVYRDVPILLSIENNSDSVLLSNEKSIEKSVILAESSYQTIQEKLIFEFDWPSDEVLLERQKKARESLKNGMLSDLSTQGSDQRMQGKTVFDFHWPDDEILRERQKKARASLRKSITLQKNDSLTDMSNNSQNLENSIPKFYPIFQKYLRQKEKQSKNINNKIPKIVHRTIRDTSKGEQLFIDAGQKEIGPKICPTCNMLYSIGQEEDERLHSDYHNMYLVNLKFQGWKEENVIGEFPDGRTLLVRKDDKAIKLKKIEDIIVIVNRDLGFPTAGFPTKQDTVFVLFISHCKRVVGCIVAEPISSASKVLLAENSADISNGSVEKMWRIGNWYSSSESVPAVCGINRVWVDKAWRRKKIATHMLDSLRCHFIHGYVVGIRELAFTDPSPDGREFAAAYTGTDNFLVYR